MTVQRRAAKRSPGESGFFCFFRFVDRDRRKGGSERKAEEKKKVPEPVERFDGIINRETIGRPSQCLFHWQMFTARLHQRGNDCFRFETYILRSVVCTNRVTQGILFRKRVSASGAVLARYFERAIVDRYSVTCRSFRRFEEPPARKLRLGEVKVNP